MFFNDYFHDTYLLLTKLMTACTCVTYTDYLHPYIHTGVYLSSPIPLSPDWEGNEDFILCVSRNNIANLGNYMEMHTQLLPFSFSSSYLSVYLSFMQFLLRMQVETKIFIGMDMHQLQMQMKYAILSSSTLI